VKFIAGLIFGIILTPVGIYLYFAGGSAPVATTDADVPFENLLTRKALKARIAKEMPKTIPIALTEANFLAGAELYKQHCALCHGLPLSPKSAIATGMYPHPPQLLQGIGATDVAPGETYWKIANGIRLTGMPGFGKSLAETQMWQVAILLANADKLPSSAKAALVASPSLGAPTPTAPSSNAPQAAPTPTPLPK